MSQRTITSETTNPTIVVEDKITAESGLATPTSYLRNRVTGFVVRPRKIHSAKPNLTIEEKNTMSILGKDDTVKFYQPIKATLLLYLTK
ncbi:hypothetical protein J6590_031400 [Homalodisca vitripennis]|nr:hypothetical protein J6590_031400 [Homalodisca vitripennis]